MREKDRVPYCGECAQFEYEDHDGKGYCGIMDLMRTHCSEQCALVHTEMSDEEIIKGLHILQKWRRGARTKMPRPHVIGVIIDAAIHRLRNK